MAISKDGLTKLTDEDKALVDEIEKKIDQELQINYHEGKELSIKLDNDLLPKLQAELTNRYEKANWSGVKIKSIQKKGLCIIFPK